MAFLISAIPHPNDVYAPRIASSVMSQRPSAMSLLIVLRLWYGVVRVVALFDGGAITVSFTVDKCQPSFVVDSREGQV